MKTPDSSRHITKEWVCFVLEEHLKKQNSKPNLKVHIKDFSIGEGAKSDDAFNSELVTLDVVSSLTEGENAEDASNDVTYHFMVKFLHTEYFNRYLNRRNHSCQKEYILYSEYIQVLNDFQSSNASGKYQINIPDFVYGKHSDNEFVLVMENIKYAGYENNDKYQGLNVTLLKEAVIQLARIHALSYVHNKTQPILKKYPFFEREPDSLRMNFLLFKVCLNNAVALLRMDKDKEGLAQKVESSTERLFAKFLACCENQNPDVPACLVHGDYWNNNIMYKNDKDTKDSKDIQCQIVDWGNSTFGSPANDLQYLMHTSVSGDNRREHLQTILQCYHAAFTEVTAAVGTPVPNWSYDELLKEWERMSVYGFLMGLALAQGTLSKSNVLFKRPQQEQSSTIMDYGVFLPIRYLTNSLKLVFSKFVYSLLTSPLSLRFADSASKKNFLPLREELLSGSNEAMNQRILDLVLDADASGLFDE